jgi:hypothetical protein
MKRLKRIALTLLIVLLSIIPILYGTVWFFGKEIRQYVISQLNRQLAVEIEVDDVQFSVIRQFPRASLLFENVTIYENYPNRKKELLTAKEIFLVFNIRDILNRNYTISEIVIHHGNANLFIDKKGRTNFTILKDSHEQEATADSISLDLQAIRLNEVNVVYNDLETDVQIRSTIKEAQVAGNFKEDRYDLKWKAESFIEELTYDRVNYIKQRNVLTDAAMHVNNTTSEYAFSKGLLTISGIDFDVQGNIRNKETSMELHLQINGSRMDVRSFLSLLPESVHEYTKEYKSTGKFYFNTTISGELSEKESPLVDVRFGIENGSVYTSGISEGLEQLNCKGQFSNGKGRNASTSVLQVSTFSAMLGAQPVKATFELINLQDPLLSLSVHGNIDLSKLSTLLPVEAVENIKGYAFANATFSGKLTSLNSKESILQSKSSGQVKLSGIAIELKGAPDTYTIEEGLFKLEGNDFIAENLTGSAGDTKIKVNGTLHRFMPFILLPDEHLHITGKIESPNLDLEKVFFTSRNEERIDSSGFIFSERLSMDMQLAVNRLKLYKFNAADVNGTFTLKNRVLKAEQLHLKTMDGEIWLNGEMNNAVKNKIMMVCDAQLKQINITQLFYQCGNFGQQELTDKHLKGKLDTRIQLASVWNTDFDCDLSKVAASADITITNGELNNYEPMMALSKYADVNDLRNLKFDKLQNSIYIKDQTIFIPQMDIRNNALNISMSGTHTFENYLDYRVKVKLSDVLRKKRNKPVNNEFEEEDTESGGLYIYLHMTGPLGNLKITYDKLSVRKKIKESIKTEQQNIKDVFRKEFQTEEDKKLKEEEKKQDEEVNWEEDLPQ